MNLRCSTLLNEIDIGQIVSIDIQSQRAHCSMPVHSDGTDGRIRTRKISCEIYQKYQWSTEELENQFRYSVAEFIAVHTGAVREIERRIEKGLFPGDRNASIHAFNRDQQMLAECNYDFNTTNELIQELTRLICVEQVLLPFDSALMNKNREEGIIFNSMPFGENRDRFAVKLKQSCSENN